MTDLVREFIEENINLIDDNRWEEIYKKAVNDLGDDTGKFTEVMLQADIHPEYNLNELPKYFLQQSSTKEFIIPDNIMSIGNYAFWGCSSLTNIIIPGSVTSINYGAFNGCSRLASITIPESVTSIGHRAFYDCTALENIFIKNPKIKLGDFSFENCQNLDIQFAGTKSQWKNISKGKFSGVTYTCICIDGIIKKSR